VRRSGATEAFKDGQVTNEVCKLSPTASIAKKLYRVMEGLESDIKIRKRCPEHVRYLCEPEVLLLGIVPLEDIFEG
jgi:hypothetical protein